MSATGTPPPGRTLVLLEGGIGLTAGLITAAIALAHFRVTHHISGLVTATVVSIYSAGVLIGGLRWKSLTPAERAWVRRAGLVIRVILIVAFVLWLASDGAGGLIPTGWGWGGGSKRGGPEPRERPHAAAFLASVCLAIIGPFVGGYIGEVTTHSDVGVLLGILVGVAIPPIAGYHLIKRMYERRAAQTGKPVPRVGDATATPLATLLPHLESARSTGTLSADVAGQLYQLFFLFGHLFHATGPGCSGDEAVRRLLAANPAMVQASFEADTRLPAKKTVKESISTLIGERKP